MVGGHPGFVRRWSRQHQGTAAAERYIRFPDRMSQISWRENVSDQLSDHSGNGMPDSGVASRGLHAEDERAVSGQRHDPVMSSAQELPLPSRPPVRGLPHRKTNFMEQFQLNCVRAVAAAADCLNGDSSIDADGAEYTAVGGRPHPGGLGQW